jgi:hypothetical protein
MWPEAPIARIQAGCAFGEINDTITIGRILYDNNFPNFPTMSDGFQLGRARSILPTFQSVVSTFSSATPTWDPIPRRPAWKINLRRISLMSFFCLILLETSVGDSALETNNNEYLLLGFFVLVPLVR